MNAGGDGMGVDAEFRMGALGAAPIEEQWSPIGEGEGDDRWTPTPAGTIGMNQPLFIRLHRVFTGPEAAGQLLISSAVKSDTTYAGAPRSLHYLFQRVQESQFASPAASANGSPIVYFTPANLDQTLHVELNLVYDRFDRERYERVIDLLQQAAGLPVFALSSAFGGLLAGAGSQAVVAGAGKAAKVLLGALDRHLDAGDDDFTATYQLHIDTPGLARAHAGWVLLRDDRERALIMYSDAEQGWAEAHEGADKDLFYVDVNDGHLHWKDSGRVVDDLDQPYVLLHVSGVSNEKLRAYRLTRVSAELLDKFFGGGPVGIDDISELMSVYNDVVMAHRVRELDAKTKGASATEKKTLKEQRAALLEHVQDEELRELLAPS